MAVPKRKHSTQRKGKRLRARKMEAKQSFPNFQKCPECGKAKLPHYPCKHCLNENKKA